MTASSALEDDSRSGERRQCPSVAESPQQPQKLGMAMMTKPFMIGEHAHRVRDMMSVR
jgi:hypothetical protein